MNAQLEPVTTAVTVGAILDRYESECLDELAPRTQYAYRLHIGHLRRRFGHLEAEALEPRTFAEFLNERKRGRINRARELAVLSAAMTIAVRRWFWIKVNILRDVERPKSKPRDRLISDEEFAACKALAPYRIQLAMQLALLTGQRQGDIIRFEWANVREVVIDDPERPGERKAITELQLQQGKTGKRLGIEVTPDLEALLDKCWQLQGGGNAGSTYVLPTRTSKPYTSAGFRAAWQKVRLKWERAGGENLRFHDIRAMAATKCPTLEMAQALLGHSTPALTRKVYRRGVERVKPLRLTIYSSNQDAAQMTGRIEHSNAAHAYEGAR